MAKIEQIYCTHCTYGSSAMERREGALAERVLGYSARASSLGDAELRKAFRHVEPFLYYYLPVDTPSEEKLRLDASQAPRRLVFYPTLNGMQMLAQVSYRQQDTAGRPGSYFGHFLIGDRAAGAWNVLDCLRLWGAGWVDQDAADLPFVLPSLAEPADLHQGARPAIDDALLLAFLSTPPDQELEDPHGVVPPRWQAASLEERAALLRDALQAHLAHGSARRESVLLVVEPSLAALIFYGVARLLPRGPLRDEVSFSTFEPRPERLPVALAATTFHQPETTDLKPECYRGRGYVHNTFLKKSSDFALGDGGYARMMVATLLAGGWREVDRLLQGFESARAGNARDLEELTHTLKLVPLLLDPAAELPNVQWSPVAVDYLGRVVRQRLAGEQADSAVLTALVGTPRHVKVLKLIATEGESEPLGEAIETLLHRLPEDGFAELLASERIAEKYKVTALVEFVRRQARFPSPCEPLWSPGPRREALLAAVLNKLPGGTLDALSESVPPPQQGAYLLGLLTVCRTNPAKNAARGQVARVMGAWRDQELCQFLSEHAATCSPPDWPEAITTLRERLPRLLHDLPSTGRQFDSRLELLWTWRSQFPDVAEAEERLDAWRNVRSLLNSLRERPASKVSGAFGKSATDPNAVGRKLAGALARAMPRKDCHDDTVGDQRATTLRRLVTVLLGRPDVLPDEVWAKMQGYLEHGGWTALTRTPGGRVGKYSPRKPKRRDYSRLILSVTFFLIGGLSVVIVAMSFSRSKPVAQQHQTAQAKTTSAGQTTSKSLAPPATAAKQSKPQTKAKDTKSSPKATEPVPPAEGAGDISNSDRSSTAKPASSEQDNPADSPKPQGGEQEAMPGAPEQPPDAASVSATTDAQLPDESALSDTATDDNPPAQPAPQGVSNSPEPSDPMATVPPKPTAPLDDTKSTVGTTASTPHSGQAKDSQVSTPPDANKLTKNESPLSDHDAAPAAISSDAQYITPTEYTALPGFPPPPMSTPTLIHQGVSALGDSTLALYGNSRDLIRQGVPNGLIIKAKFKGNGKPEKSDLARFDIVGRDVTFQWISSNVDSKYADLLKCCVLNIDTGKGASAWIALATQQRVPAPSIVKGMATVYPYVPLQENGNSALEYYLGAGEIISGETRYPFESTSPSERQPLQILTLPNRSSAGYIRAEMGNGNQVHIRITKGKTSKNNDGGFDEHHVHGSLFRIVNVPSSNNKKPRQIRVTDIQVGDDLNIGK